jgi:hypothetical protein
VVTNGSGQLHVHGLVVSFCSSFGARRDAAVDERVCEDKKTWSTFFSATLDW